MTARKAPAVVILFFLVTGIILADNARIPSGVYLMAGLVSILAGVALSQSHRKIPAIAVILMGLAALSGYNFALRYKTFPPGHISHFTDDDRKYVIYAKVDDWPALYEHKTVLYAEVDSLGLENRIFPGQGEIIINIAVPTTKIQYGDGLILESRLFAIKGGANPTGFDYRRHLNLKGIFAACYLPHELNIRVNSAGKYKYNRIIQELRQEILEIFRQTLKPENAAIASGFFLGETRDIPEYVYGYFRDSGTLHLLAVSGSNVWLLVGLFAFLLMASNLKVWRKSAILIAVVIVFSSLAHNQPSVVRAAVMAILVLTGRALQRRIDLNNIIASAAALILVVEPAQLFDIGFQLSFAVAWALVFITPRILAHVKANPRRKYINWLIFPVVISFVAQVTSLPIIAFYFGKVPLISFMANLIIVPLTSILVIGEMILLLAYTLLPFLGQLVGIPLNALMDLNLFFLELFGSKSSFEPLTFSLPGWAVILYLVILVTGTLAIDSKKARRYLVFLLIFTGCIWQGSRVMMSGCDYRLTVFSLARGNMAICESPQTAQLFMADLTDQGYISAEKTVVPYLNNRGIRNLSIVSLTADYATLQEAVATARLFDTVQLYIPEKCRSLMADILRWDKTIADTGDVIFFSDSMDYKLLKTGEAGLREGSAWLRFDSLDILILSESAALTDTSRFTPVISNRLLLIKPVLKPEDTLFLSRVDLQLLVCRDLSRGQQEGMGIAPYYRNFLSHLWLTSRAGAANISIYRGRPNVRD